MFQESAPEKSDTKTEEEAAQDLMSQIKQRGHPETPPAIATDGKGGYREAMVQAWGKSRRES